MGRYNPLPLPQGRHELIPTKCLVAAHFVGWSWGIGAEARTAQALASASSQGGFPFLRETCTEPRLRGVLWKGGAAEGDRTPIPVVCKVDLWGMNPTMLLTDFTV